MRNESACIKLAENAWMDTKEILEGDVEQVRNRVSSNSSYRQSLKEYKVENAVCTEELKQLCEQVDEIDKAYRLIESLENVIDNIEVKLCAVEAKVSEKEKIKGTFSNSWFNLNFFK